MKQVVLLINMFVEAGCAVVIFNMFVEAGCAVIIFRELKQVVHFILGMFIKLCQNIEEKKTE